MTNLLQQAINCDDADRAARASKGDDVVNYRFSRQPGRTIASSAPVTLANG